LLSRLGRLDESLKECEIAQELDPNHDHMFDILVIRRECDRRIPLLKRWIDLYPNEFVEHEELAHCYWMKGMLKEAEEEAERAWILLGSKEMAARIHEGFATAGLKGSLRASAEGIEELASKKQAFLPMNAADVYAQLGNKDRAFYWLDQAYQHPELANVYEGLTNLKTDPWLDPLRSDPRYKDLLRRVGLPH
jgi:tetratricopeptide (TPR) repeat protein